MSAIIRRLFRRHPTRLQACWIQQGQMMRMCGFSENDFDSDATVAKWQRVGYNNV